MFIQLLEKTHLKPPLQWSSQYALMHVAMFGVWKDFKKQASGFRFSKSPEHHVADSPNQLHQQQVYQQSRRIQPT